MGLLKNVVDTISKIAVQSRGASTISRTPVPSQWAKKPLQNPARYESQSYSMGNAQAIPPQLIKRDHSFGNVQIDPLQHAAGNASQAYNSMRYAQPQLQPYGYGYGGVYIKEIIPPLGHPPEKPAGYAAPAHANSAQRGYAAPAHANGYGYGGVYAQAITQPHVIALQNGLISKLRGKDQPKPEQDKIKDNKSLLREIILNSDNTEQDRFIEILLNKNEDGNTIITLAADTKYVTEFDAIICALQNKKISTDKITTILNTPNDIGYTALDIVLSHIENEPENIDIEAAEKIKTLLLNNRAEFSEKKIPSVENKDITESLNKLIKNRKSNQDKPPANQEQNEDTRKSITAVYSSYNKSGSSNSSQKTASKGSSRESTFSKAKTQTAASPQLTDSTSSDEFIRNGYKVSNDSTHKNPSPAPTLQLSANAPHKFCSRHGALQRRPQRPYNTALANGEHTLLPYCYYKEKNGEVSMCL